VKQKRIKKAVAKKPLKRSAVEERNLLDNKHLSAASNHPVEVILKELHTSMTGLNEEGVSQSRERHGRNKITKAKKITVFQRLLKAFIDPFTGILFILAGVSLVTDVILADPAHRNPMTVIIIVTMVLISGTLRFIQEIRSDKAAEKLQEMVETTAAVEREGVKAEIPLDEIVVGDIVHLSAGDIVPADVRIITVKDLFISQSTLTGESEPVEKLVDLPDHKFVAMTDRKNLAFMGTTVISGAAKAVVVLVGNDTLLGRVAKKLTEKVEKTSFEKGVSSVSWLLIRFMLILVPVVFFVNGFTKGDWLEAFLFAISIAVGLTPEMLPMIMTTTLAKGAVAMSREKTIIKNLNSIQGFGSMDVLCTDKTGTLTQDRVVLQYHLDVMGFPNLRVLRHGFLNSYFQTGLKNLMDNAIISKTEQFSKDYPELQNLAQNFEKVDEIPFDFSRRRMTVVVRDKSGKTQMITKGAVEEILSICSYVEYDNAVSALTPELTEKVMATINRLNDQGMRVIAVSQKNNPSSVGTFGVSDETEMVLIGLLAFYDPPKDSAFEAIRALKEYGVTVKVLTGDNDRVTRSVCQQVGIASDSVILGTDVDRMDDGELCIAVEKTNIFAKLSPEQKARIVGILKINQHVVGYLGDGINDAPALRASDVGVSVDTAVDIAKESANIILLEKSLMVLKNGIVEGRKTYANMIKYIKMTASSNFGNMLSVVLASAFLPFLPMMPVHLLLLNLIYDISCAALPWDRVDKEYLQKPRQWSAKNIGRFMIFLGPVSSLFDIATYLLMFYIICPKFIGGSYFDPGTDKVAFMIMFQTGWFVESMWSQSLVIHTLRSSKLPFIQTMASWPILIVSALGIGTLTYIPFTAFGRSLGLMALPTVYFLWLGGIILVYMILATLMKYLYIKIHGELL